jgi:hypothetical protein
MMPEAGLVPEIPENPKVPVIPEIPFGMADRVKTCQRTRVTSIRPHLAGMHPCVVGALALDRTEENP